MTTEATFRDFELDPRLIEAVTALGFESPTPIQVSAIPTLLSGKDVIGRARTGSGKTAAFGLPLLHIVAANKNKRKGVKAIVLAPTRELAIQVATALEDYAKKTKLRVCAVYGGAAYGPQLRALREGVDVVVGTPGRVIDHIDRGTLLLNDVEMFVLDEADEMLRMGFIDDVERILEGTGPDKQMALFSATMPPPIQRVAQRHLKEPVVIQVENQQLTTTHVTQKWISVPERRKIDALYRVLTVEKRGATLIFARTRQSCAETCEMLNSRGIRADALHGDLNQQLRERVLHRLKNDQIDVVVATDVAARGLDVDTLTHVINFDLPGDTETYVHRIGRTARAGREGTAISFVTPGERRRLMYMERDLKQKIEEADLPTDADIARLQLETLKKDLSVTYEAKHTEEVQKWLQEWIGEGIWSIDEIATAALGLLIHERGIQFASARKPPEPKKERPKREDRPVRDDRPVREDRPAKAKKERPARDDGPRNIFEEDAPDFDDLNGMFVHISAGRRHGVRPADIVGALANDTGISGKSIGKVMIGDTGTVVGLPTEIGDMVLNDYKHIAVRGRTARVSAARPQQFVEGPERSVHVKKRGKPQR